METEDVHFMVARTQKEKRGQDSNILPPSRACPK
jgi:hypothetical protein